MLTNSENNQMITLNVVMDSTPVMVQTAGGWKAGNIQRVTKSTSIEIYAYEILCLRRAAFFRREDGDEVIGAFVTFDNSRRGLGREVIPVCNDCKELVDALGAIKLPDSVYANILYDQVAINERSRHRKIPLPVDL